MPETAFSEVESVLWLVRLRWAAISAVAVVVSVAAALGVLPALWPLVLVAAAMGAANIVFAWFARPDRRAPRRWLTLQILLDIIALAALLHFSGGADNPFVVLFVLPMVVAAMLLPLGTGLLLALATTTLFGTIVVLEASGFLTHHSLRIGTHHLVEHHPGGAIWRSGLYMVGYFVAQLAALSGTVFFVHSLAERFRRAEARRREQAHVAESRERLARIGALSAGVAHTVRNPLHALLSCLEILQRRLGDEDPSVGETLDLMGQGIDRIERVTRRLLALGGEQAEQRSTIDLRDVLDDALSFVDVQARNRGLAIKRELAELPMARVDADRLIDAFSGVLENAVRACEEGDRITLRLIAPGPDGAGPTVEVEDTGCGMSAEVMGRVFDPFFTTRPVGEGTGLGLAITRRVILDHGGRVELESEPERGTMVRIVFPKEILVA